MRADMCTDMCEELCADMCTDTCEELCTDMCVSVSLGIHFDNYWRRCGGWRHNSAVRESTRLFGETECTMTTTRPRRTTSQSLAGNLEVYTHVCTNVYAHVWTHTCALAETHVHANVYVYVYIHAYTHV